MLLSVGELYLTRSLPLLLQEDVLAEAEQFYRNTQKTQLFFKTSRLR